RSRRGLARELVRSMRRIAEQPRPLGADAHDAGDDRGVVVCTLKGARDRGAVDALAQRTVLELCEHGMGGRVLQRDQPMPVESASFSGLGAGIDLVARETIELREPSA